MQIDREKLIQYALASDDPDVVVAVYRLISSPFYSFVPRPDQPELLDEQTSFVNDKFDGISCIIGGNRCLAGEQKIYDPVKNCYKRIDEITSSFHVFSRDEDGSKVIGIASKPFVKGYEDIYEVELSNGSKFRCTLGHQLLTPDGYISLKDLTFSSPLESSSDTCPSMFQINARHYNASKVYITKINFIRKDLFYDLTVKDYHNYECAGIWHHNSGKSYSAAWKLANFLKTIPPPEKQTRVWVCSQTMEMAIGVCWTQHLQKLLPEAVITAWYNMQRAFPKVVEIRHPNNNSWVIEFKSYDMGRGALQGAAVASYWLDEQCPMNLINEIDARSSNYHYPGSKIYSLTPLTPDVELERIFMEREEHPRWKFYRLNARCNTTIDHAFLDNCLEQDLETRSVGSFTNYTGAIYPHFSQDNIIDNYNIDPNWERVNAIDFGWDHPTVFLAGVKTPSGKYIITDEYYQNKNSIEEHIESIKHLYKSGNIWADYAQAQERHEFAIRGLPTRPSHKDIMAGIARVQHYLRKQADGTPGLLIYKNCKNLLREIRSYHWNPNVPNCVWKRDDDACDALRYLIFSDGKEYEPIIKKIPEHKYFLDLLRTHPENKIRIGHNAPGAGPKHKKF